MYAKSLTKYTVKRTLTQIYTTHHDVCFVFVAEQDKW